MKNLFENWRKFTENIDVDVEVGDVILGGKYKNKRMVVKEIGKDELGQPTVNGKPMLKFRIEKHLPDNKKSKKTLDAEKENLDEAKVSKSVLKTLRDWPKGWRGGASPGKYYGNFKKSDWTADDKGYIEDKGRGYYILSDLGREVLAANQPEEEKVNEQESGLPPGFQGFDVGEPDAPVGSTAGMREIERNFGTYASVSNASRYLKPAGLSLLKRYGDGRESIQIYTKADVLGWAVELSKVTDASTAKNIGQKIKRNLWGKRSPKLTSQQWHLHDLPMWVAYDEGAERIEAPQPPPPRQGTLFENWREYLKEEEGIGCPIRGAIYGGIPSGGGFLATTEYEVAASNIAEAAHCILGSLGKRIGGLAKDMDKSEWQGMVYGETEHLTEEIGIIMKALKEYQRDVYTRQINDIEQYKPEWQDRIRKRNDKMVGDIREKAPMLIENAQDKLARLDKVEATEPDFPPQVMAVGRLSYQLLISLSESLLKSVENWDETKQVPPELNAYKNKELQTLGNRLNGAIKIMIQEMGR